MASIRPLETATVVDRSGITYTIKWSSDGSKSDLDARRTASLQIMTLRLVHGLIEESV